MIEVTSLDEWITREIVSKMDFLQSIPLVEKLIENGEAGREVAELVLTRPEATNHPWLLEKLILRGGATAAINTHVLSRPAWASSLKVARLCGGKKPTVAILKEALARGEHLGRKTCGQELAAN